MDYFRNSMGPVEKRLRYSGIDKRNVHDVALIGGSARVPIVQKMIQDFWCQNQVPRGRRASRSWRSLAFDAHRNLFANELGRRNCVTGEVWKDKPPFRLALNKATSDDIAWQCKHYTGHGVGGAGPNGAKHGGRWLTPPCHVGSGRVRDGRRRKGRDSEVAERMGRKGNEPDRQMGIGG